MLGIGLKISRNRNGSSSPPPVVGFDADYQALLDYATFQTYTLPTDPQQELQNQLVLDLKSAGFWSRMDSFAVFATDGDRDFALIDWKRLVNFYGTNTPAFTPNYGFEGNGNSTWIDTNYNPSVHGSNYQRDNAGISTRLWSTATDGKYLIGTNSGADGELRMRNHSNFNQLIDGQFNSSYKVQSQDLNTNRIGHFHLDRYSSAAFIYQFNGDLGSVYNQFSTGVPQNNINIFRLTTNYGDQGVSYFAARNGFSFEEKNQFNSIMDTYLNAIV